MTQSAGLRNRINAAVKPQHMRVKAQGKRYCSQPIRLKTYFQLGLPGGCLWEVRTARRVGPHDGDRIEVVFYAETKADWAVKPIPLLVD